MGKIIIPTLREIVEANSFHSTLYVFDRGYSRCDVPLGRFTKKPSYYQQQCASPLDLDRVVIAQRHERAIALLSEGRLCTSVNMRKYDEEFAATLDKHYDAVFIAGDNLADNFENMLVFRGRAPLSFVEVNPKTTDESVVSRCIKNAPELELDDADHQLFRINKTGRKSYHI